MALQEQKFVRWLVTLARNSPWLFIAIGLHAILAVVMSVVYIHHELQKANNSATEIAVSTKRDAPQEVVQPPEELNRQKIPENEKQAELVTLEEEQTFVPTEEVEEDLHMDIGDPTGSDDGSEASTGGTSIGVGSGGHFGTGTPSSLISRRPGTANVRKKGRSPNMQTIGTEEAVLEGLRWLLRHQNEDGSWSPATVHEHCSKTPCIPADPTLDRTYDVGMTALALLAFLGQGINVGSKLEITDTAMGKRYQAGEAVKKGVRWLMDRQKEEGYFSDSEPFEYPENETLSTMVLCEAYGLSNPRNRPIKQAAQKALDFLFAAQKQALDGGLSGWGFGSRADIEARHARAEIDDEAYQNSINNVDLWVTCWVAMALRSAQSCGLDVSENVLQGALTFALAASEEAATHPEVAPTNPNEKYAFHAARTLAPGMLIRSFVSRDITDPYLEKSAKAIVEDVPKVSKDQLSVDFYYWYFATLALFQYDGPDSPRKGHGEFWKPWNEALIKSMLELQDDNKGRDVCSRGGWLSGSRGNSRGKALYNTALNVLTLEVYYRFGNVFGAKDVPAGSGVTTSVTPK